MKSFFTILLLLVLSLVLAIANNLEDDETKAIIENNHNSFIKTSQSVIQTSLSYEFKIDLKFHERKLEVIQTMRLNGLNDSILFISLPVNAFEHDHTVYNKGKLVDRRTFCSYNISSSKLNNLPIDLDFIKHDIFTNDRTMAKINLNEVSSDEVVIDLIYSIDLPVNAEMFGYSKGNDLCMLTNWHPYIVNDSTQAFHRRDLVMPNRMPAIYRTAINVEEDITIVSSGNSINSNTGIISEFEQADGNSMNFIFLNEIITSEFNIGGQQKEINLKIYMLDQNERYINRIVDLVKNTIEFLESEISPFPKDQISIVNVPNKMNFGFRNYGNISTVYCDLISPLGTLNPEYELCRLIIKQFIDQINLDNSSDRWVEEGLVTYLATQVLSEYYDPPNEYFYFARYYPVYGLNFLSYNSIPIIYTINNYSYKPILRNIERFYSNKNINSILNARISNYDKDDFLSVFDTRTAIILESLAIEIGRDKFLSIIKKVLNGEMSNQSFTNSFYSILSTVVGKDAAAFLLSNFEKSNTYDYAIGSIEDIMPNVYEIDLLKLGNASTPVVLNIVTEDDSTKYFWDGQTNKKTLVIKTNTPLSHASLKLQYAELLDINIANNTYLMNPNYLGPFAISLRTFFWFQNALMIFGSIG